MRRQSVFRNAGPLQFTGASCLRVARPYNCSAKHGNDSTSRSSAQAASKALQQSHFPDPSQEKSDATSPEQESYSDNAVSSLESWTEEDVERKLSELLKGATSRSRSSQKQRIDHYEREVVLGHKKEKRPSFAKDSLLSQLRADILSDNVHATPQENRKRPAFPNIYPGRELSLETGTKVEARAGSPHMAVEEKDLFDTIDESLAWHKARKRSTLDIRQIKTRNALPEQMLLTHRRIVDSKLCRRDPISSSLLKSGLEYSALARDLDSMWFYLRQLQKRGRKIRADRLEATVAAIRVIAKEIEGIRETQDRAVQDPRTRLLTLLTGWPNGFEQNKGQHRESSLADIIHEPVGPGHPLLKYNYLESILRLGGPRAAFQFYNIYMKNQITGNDAQVPDHKSLNATIKHVCGVYPTTKGVALAWAIAAPYLDDETAIQATTWHVLLQWPEELEQHGGWRKHMLRHAKRTMEVLAAEIENRLDIHWDASTKRHVGLSDFTEAIRTQSHPLWESYKAEPNIKNDPDYVEARRQLAMEKALEWPHQSMPFMSIFVRTRKDEARARGLAKAGAEPSVQGSASLRDFGASLNE